MMDAKIIFQEEDGKALYAYKIEKLEEISQSDDLLLILDAVAQAISGISKGLYGSVEEFKQKYPEATNVQKLKEYMKSHPAMTEAINVLGKYSKGHAKIDLMDNIYNFMQRPDGTIIINDPFAS